MMIYIVVLHDYEADWPGYEIAGVYSVFEDAVVYLEKRGYLSKDPMYRCWYYPTDDDFVEAEIVGYKVMFHDNL